MRHLAALVAGIVLTGAAAGAAGATNECRGLQVCVPVAGPWVVTGGGAQVSFRLTCPERFVVAGLDAELSRTGVDVTFRGSLGSPVNPGITTSRSVDFLARLLVVGGPATFRPHVGCVPAAGGGERFPTVHRPSPALVPVAIEIAVRPGFRRYVERCPAGEHLTGATHAVGFYTPAPPSTALVKSVTVSQAVRAGLVRLAVRAGALPGVRAVVQVELGCA